MREAGGRGEGEVWAWQREGKECCQPIELAFKFVSCMDITYSINCNDVDGDDDDGYDECSTRITLIFG